MKVLEWTPGDDGLGHLHLHVLRYSLKAWNSWRRLRSVRLLPYRWPVTL